MFLRVVPKLVSTQGIVKHILLLALFNNAKKSKWTEATIRNLICTDEFVRKLPIFTTTYGPQIADKINKINLSEENAIAILKSNSRVDYIDEVGIKIDFSGDIIDVGQYESMHKESDGVLSVEDVIKSLIPKPAQTSTPSMSSL
jgi:hypothetical protein